MLRERLLTRKAQCGLAGWLVVRQCWWQVTVLRCRVGREERKEGALVQEWFLEKFLSLWAAEVSSQFESG